MGNDDRRGDASRLFLWRKAIASKECELSSTARLVAFTVSLKMNRDGGSAYPGGTWLAEATALSVRSVRRALADLESSGWLVVVKRGGSPRSGERMATEYRANIPTGDTVTPVTQSHQCHSVHRPVTETTVTGDTESPQDVKKTREKSGAKLSTIEFVRQAGGCQHEQTFVERLEEYFVEEADRLEALEIWRRVADSEKAAAL